jgi:hypothetical protein
MDAVYVVERWFDSYTYEGIFGVFAARGLADMAVAEQHAADAERGSGWFEYRVRRMELGQYEIG